MVSDTSTTMKCAVAFTASIPLSVRNSTKATSVRKLRARSSVSASLLPTFEDISFNPQSPATSGSFGDVFFGTEAGSQRQVVLKRCRRCRNARELFRTERLVNRTLNGEEYWPLYLGEHERDSEQYLVWKREQNASTLHNYLFERPISDLYAALGVVASAGAGVESGLFENVVTQLLLAVGELHASGFVHRDVKPSNILVVRDETRGRYRLKLIDFGSCKDTRAFSWWFNTKLDTLDPLYAAPETRFELGDAAYKFDVFSIGMIGLAVAFGGLRSQETLRCFRRRMEAADWNLHRLQQESERDGMGCVLGNDARVLRVLRGMLSARSGGRWSVRNALRELGVPHVP